MLEDPKKIMLIVISRKQSLSAFHDGDNDLFRYRKMMKFIAICIDILKFEDNTSQGIVLPKLKLIKSLRHGPAEGCSYPPPISRHEW